MATNTVTGLSGDRYLFNNPIWVDITNIGPSAKWLNFSIKRADDPSINVLGRFAIFNGAVAFDISEYIKGMAFYPHYPDGVILTGQDIETNYHELIIKFDGISATGQLTSTSTLTKTFIRGGLEAQTTNNSLGPTSILKESVKVPRWNGYEFRIYKMENNKIIMEDNYPAADTDNIPLVGCNPLYFRFANMIGGYSNWLFENWEVIKSTEKTKVIRRREKDISTGHKSSYKLTVEGRVDRRYFKLMRALVQSPEVAVYGLSAKMDDVSGFVKASSWEQVWNRSNSSPIDSLQKLENVKFEFDYLLKLKTETIW